jgi:hypothetical protein
VDASLVAGVELCGEESGVEHPDRIAVAARRIANVRDMSAAAG